MSLKLNENNLMLMIERTNTCAGEWNNVYLWRSLINYCVSSNMIIANWYVLKSIFVAVTIGVLFMLNQKLTWISNSKSEVELSFFILSM